MTTTQQMTAKWRAAKAARHRLTLSKLAQHLGSVVEAEVGTIQVPTNQEHVDPRTKGYSMAGLCVLIMHHNDLDGAKRTLESLGALRCLAVLADTGSESAIRDQLATLGSPIIDVAWRGSYADMVNQAIESQPADLIFRMDSDEYVLEGQAEQLASALGRLERNQCGWIWRREKISNNEFMHGRIHRALWKSSGDRYVGLVHERIWSGAASMLYPKDSGVFLNAILGHESDHFTTPTPDKYRPLIDKEALSNDQDRMYHRLLLSYYAYDGHADYEALVRIELDHLLKLTDNQIVLEWASHTLLLHGMCFLWSETMSNMDWHRVATLLLKIEPSNEDTIFFLALYLRRFGATTQALLLFLTLKEWISLDALISRTHYTRQELDDMCTRQIVELEEYLDSLDDDSSNDDAKKEEQDQEWEISSEYADYVVHMLFKAIEDDYARDRYDVFPCQPLRRLVTRQVARSAGASSPFSQGELLISPEEIDRLE